MMHKSVFLKESVSFLLKDKSGIYVDATLGRGGHLKEILAYVSSGRVLGIDKDLQAIQEVQTSLSDRRLTLIHGDFRNIRSLLLKEGISKVDGILVDLGVSSPQFDQSERGFSYRFDGPLDMRMDQRQTLTAEIIVNNYSEKELVDIFRKYGEETYASIIAKNILKFRIQNEITTTYQLVEIIKGSLPQRELKKKGHPAKRVFQALRIEVNDELGSLVELIHSSLSLLKVGGRLVIITFHSLEDRIVKKMFKEVSTVKVDSKLPLKEKDIPNAKFKLITKKAIKPSLEEIDSNHRSHSAKLRVIERVEE